MTAGWWRCRRRRSARRCRGPTWTTCWCSPPTGSRPCRRCSSRSRRPPRDAWGDAVSRPTSLLLSTRNPHKVREFHRLFAAGGISVDPLPEDVELPPEDGETFADNALPKARAAAAATGRIAIADDSGIEAAALGGRPGVRSARYAGVGAPDEENLAKLLAEAPAGSGLAYVCALAYVDLASGEEHLFEGRWTGRLAQAPRGERGFGYDPAFLPEEHPEMTAAELSDERKDELNHRGRAVGALREWL